MKCFPGFVHTGFHICTGATKLVNEYRNYPDRRHIIHNLDGHAIMIKLKTG